MKVSEFHYSSDASMDGWARQGYLVNGSRNGCTRVGTTVRHEEQRMEQPLPKLPMVGIGFVEVRLSRPVLDCLRSRKRSTW